MRCLVSRNSQAVNLVRPARRQQGPARQGPARQGPARRGWARHQGTEEKTPVISRNHNSWNHNPWNHNVDAGDRKACHFADTASYPVNRNSRAATTRRSPTNPAAAQAGTGARGETYNADAACRAAAASAARGAAAGQAEMHAGPAVQMNGPGHGDARLLVLDPDVVEYSGIISRLRGAHIV